MYGIFEFYMFVLFLVSVSCLFFCCRNGIRKVKRDIEQKEIKKTARIEIKSKNIISISNK